MRNLRDPGSEQSDEIRALVMYWNLVRDSLEAVWPPYGLRILTPRLELQFPDEIDLMRLADAIERYGIHDPGFVPMGDWTLHPSHIIQRKLMQWQWTQRANWTPKDWRLEMVVIARDQGPFPRAIGIQSIFAHDFVQLGSVLTGSWLAKEYHGNGYGTEMRQAMLHFAFEYLGAQRAISDYWHDNIASQRVSAKCGYRVTGERWELRATDMHGGTRPDRHIYVEASPDTWRRPNYPVEVSGFVNCREMFGLE